MRVSYEEVSDIHAWLAEAYMAESTHSFNQWKDFDTRLRYAFYLVGWTTEEWEDELYKRLSADYEELYAGQ